jgi:hypothetical protein
MEGWIAVRKIFLLLTIGFAGLAVGCNSADDDVQNFAAGDAADLFIDDISSRRETFTADFTCATVPPTVCAKGNLNEFNSCREDGDCDLFVQFDRLGQCSISAPFTFDIQVIKISAVVNWLGSTTCVGSTPRECSSGPNAGIACTTNADCPSSECAGRPCSLDSDCDGADTCGAPTSRLVFASALIDPVTQTEKGVILFDNGDALVPLNSPGGDPTGDLVFTGDDVAEDLIYTREFAVLTATNAPWDDCVAKGPLQMTSLTSIAAPELTFTIDAIDAVSGAARLTSVTAVQPIIVTTTCCRRGAPPDLPIQEFCGNFDPICQIPP